jgi:hypothetical protein
MESNDDTTRFLSLPNELIYYIFKYMSPIDLMVAFGYLSNDRLQQSLASYMSSMDLNLTDSKSLIWFDQHRAVVQRYVKRIITDIEFAEKLLRVLPKLDELTVIYNEDTQHFLDWFVAHFQTVTDVHVAALTLSTYDGVMKTDTTNLLLGGNGQLPERTLNVSDCHLPLDIHNLPSHSRLRHLNCIVQDETFLHALLARLPNLETIKIGFISSGLEMESDFLANAIFMGLSIGKDLDSGVESRVIHHQYKPKKNAAEIIVVAPPHLDTISITGHIANFNHLSQPFQLASTSLKRIKLKVYAYSIVDPDQLNRVAKRIDFDFHVDYQQFQLPSNFD